LWHWARPKQADKKAGKKAGKKKRRLRDALKKSHLVWMLYLVRVLGLLCLLGPQDADTACTECLKCK
jgi:hypothetical protein